MISKISVQGFQSLVDVSLELEPFTVVVGRSSSGKSAVIRAIRALHTNGFSKEQITHGEKLGRITAERRTAEGIAVVCLERGASATYRLTQPGGAPVEYSKLARSVPEAVETALGIKAENIELIFGQQFDKPFLLDETGSEVARTFGELTNVSLIFTAAREAQRRKLESSALLKTRTSDLALIVEQEKVFADLPERILGQEELEAEFIKAKRIEETSQSLGVAIERFGVAEANLVDVPSLDLLAIDEEFTRATKLAQQEQLLGGAITRWEEAQLSLVGAPDPIALPSVDDAEIALRARDQFLNIFAQLSRHKSEFTSANGMIVQLESEIEMLSIREHDVLLAAGQCPLCLQEIM